MVFYTLHYSTYLPRVGKLSDTLPIFSAFFLQQPVARCELTSSCLGCTVHLLLPAPRACLLHGPPGGVHLAILTHELLLACKGACSTGQLLTKDENGHILLFSIPLIDNIEVPSHI